MARDQSTEVWYLETSFQLEEGLFLNWLGFFSNRYKDTSQSTIHIEQIPLRFSRLLSKSVKSSGTGRDGSGSSPGRETFTTWAAAITGTSRYGLVSGPIDMLGEMLRAICPSKNSLKLCLLNKTAKIADQAILTDVYAANGNACHAQQKTATVTILPMI